MNPHQKWWGFFMPACEIIMHADHLFVFNWHVPNRIDLETRQVICQVNQFCHSAGPVRILFGKEIYPFVIGYNKIILIFV
jgi:hypothetical protein